MGKNKDNGKLLGVWMVLLQTLLYGIGTPITKAAYESITPLWCLALRFLLAAAVLAPFAGKAALRELRGAKAARWLPSALTMALSYITFNAALAFSSATTVGFLMSLSVVFTPVLSSLVRRQKYKRSMLPAQAMAVGGLYLLCCGGGRFSFGWGELLAIVCSLCVAGSLVFGQESLASLSPGTVSLAQLSVTALLSLCGALLFEPVFSPGAVSPQAWLTVLYLAIPCGCLAYWLQNSALARLPSAAVSLTQCAEPVFTAGASFLILGERLSAAGWAGGALLLLCIVYGNLAELRTGVNKI